MSSERPPTESCHRSKLRASGFTLIELLVVIAILAILASLLLPALTRAKKMGHVAGCTSNLRQMGISVQLYTLDNEDKMPLLYERYFGAPPERGLVGKGHGWTVFGLLLTQTEIPMKAFRCPADRRNYELTEKNFYNIGPGISWEEIKFDYTANAIGHGMTTRRLPWSLPPTSPFSGDLKHSDIPDPSKMWLIFDGHIPLWTVGGGWNQMKKWGELTIISKTEGPVGWWEFDTTFRHSYFVSGGLRDATRGPNVVMADGHVVPRATFRGRSDDDFNLPVP